MFQAESIVWIISDGSNPPLVVQGGFDDAVRCRTALWEEHRERKLSSWEIEAALMISPEVKA